MNTWKAMAVVVVSVLVSACSGGGGAAELPAAAAEGRAIAQENGCAACHGQDGEGSIGPAWAGLAGSVVRLSDGSTVVADREYLRRSIVDPSAELVDGYNVLMPSVDLRPDQVDALVAYIEELG